MLILVFTNTFISKIIYTERKKATILKTQAGRMDSFFLEFSLAPVEKYRIIIIIIS